MILLLRLIVKIVKWAVIVVAYMIMGLVKLLTIAILLVFFGARAAIRHARMDTDEEEPDLYRGFYDLERRASLPSGDSFDATVQRERDHRVARSRKARVE
jgi:hypothetical protein